MMVYGCRSDYRCGIRNLSTRVPNPQEVLLLEPETFPQKRGPGALDLQESVALHPTDFL